MKRQNEGLEKQSAAYRLALSVDVALKFDAQFNEPHFKLIRSKAAKALLLRTNEVEAEDVFDFFDTVGLCEKEGAITDELSYSLFFHWINLYWEAGKRHVGSEQMEGGTTWSNFRSLYERVRAIERQRDPESRDLNMSEARLREQLKEEIGLQN